MSYSYDISIIGGLGHVGLPLGIYFAHKGKKTLLIDKNKNNSKIVEKGLLPFKEDINGINLKKLIKSNIKVSLNLSDISESKFIIVALGTPVNQKGIPETKPFIYMVKKIIDLMNKDQILVIRSSVYPGLIDEIIKIASKKKIKNIAYCPERISQGNSINELKTLPQVISTYDKFTENEVSKLFKLISPKIIKAQVKEVELMKLFTNSWRYILFGISNEFFMISKKLGLNYENIRKIMIDDYPRAKNIPTAGFASGPCLHKDTIQLSHYLGDNFLFGNAAKKINQNITRFILNELQKNTNLKNKIVGILGMAFKANNDDMRDSLSLKLKKELKNKCKLIYCSDEYVNSKNFVSKDFLIKKCDIIIIGSPHKQYKKLNLKNKKIINIWEGIL